MAKRIVNKTILIIAEGENTEPFYFRAIEQIFLKSKDDLRISLTLRIISEVAESKKKASTPKNKTPRKERQVEVAIPVDYVQIFMDGEEIYDELLKIDEEYKSQPQRFVRRAQVEMKDESYTEAWAVFDYDTRPLLDIQKAFEMASDPLQGIVDIAYSSIAFEQWLLLHYERNLTAFIKSECRENIGTGKNKRKIHINCGNDVELERHIKDCMGSKCVGGYLRTKRHYLESSKKDEKIFYTHEDKLATAFFNASWLRYKMNITEPLTKDSALDTNPYTNVDVMIKSLLYELPTYKEICSSNYKWIELNNVSTINGFVIEVSRVSNTITIFIKNKTGQTHILQDSFIEIKNRGLQTIQSSGARTSLGVDEEALPLVLILNSNAEFLLINIETDYTICLELS